jgi:hypothetical protein
VSADQQALLPTVTAPETGWLGAPFDYVHFEGNNPRHNEGMTPIDSRALWERHVAP